MPHEKCTNYSEEVVTQYLGKMLSGKLYKLLRCKPMLTYATEEVPQYLGKMMFAYDFL